MVSNCVTISDPSTGISWTYPETAGTSTSERTFIPVDRWAPTVPIHWAYTYPLIAALPNITINLTVCECSAQCRDKILSAEDPKVTTE